MQGPSKSRVKREHQALQGLAERLLELPPDELERLDLSPALWSAVEESTRIRDPRARRRHYKRVAKILAGENLQGLRTLLQDRDALARQARARHQRVERWRERMIMEGDGALGAFLELCPDADRQQLRTLLRAARRDRERGRPDAPRRLFRYLREELERSGAP